MPDRDLKLNSLPRFSKKSSQFILEEHSHCEVPAGCGGVVLRWRNPNQGIPLQTWVYTTAKCEMFLDGVMLSSARPIIPWGQHVWGFTISETNPEYAVLMFAASYGDKEMHIKSTGPSVDPISFLSKPDGSWKYSMSEPANSDWMSPDYDDSQWLPMVPKEINPASLEKTSKDGYRIKKLQGFGAESLGIAELGASSGFVKSLLWKRSPAMTKLWVRQVFSVEAKPSSN
jgi:hypothetical protein